MAHGNTVQRIFEKKGYNFEITGTSAIRLWINGNLYSVTFKSLRDARMAAISYADRHSV